VHVKRFIEVYTEGDLSGDHAAKLYFFRFGYVLQAMHECYIISQENDKPTYENDKLI
jgi:hypothetical protein